jgi:hypothetical protein
MGVLPAQPNAVPDPSPAPSPERFERPQTFIELISDLTRRRCEAKTLLIIVAGLMGIVMASVAFVVVCFIVVAMAAKGIKIGSLSSPRTVFPAGIGAGSILAFLASRVRRWLVRLLRKLAKDDRADPPGS